jgi:gas vesicle protein
MNNTIIVNNFGNENTSYMETLKYFNDYLLEKPAKSIESMVKNTHFHPNHPENYNVMIPNVSRNFYLIKRHGENEIVDGNTLLDNLICKMAGRIDDLIKMHQNDISDYKRNKKLPRLNTVIDDIYNNVTRKIKQLKRDIRTTFINNQRKLNYDHLKIEKKQNKINK